MKALIIMDMTNDFVFEKYEHEGKEYEGRLVAPLGKTIVEPIEALVKKVVNSGTVSLFRISKDHYDAFTNPELELKVAELGIVVVFMTGLGDEICIYHNTLGFLERGFRTKVVSCSTAP